MTYMYYALYFMARFIIVAFTKYMHVSYVYKCVFEVFNIQTILSIIYLDWHYVLSNRKVIQIEIHEKLSIK